MRVSTVCVGLSHQLGYLRGILRRNSHGNEGARDERFKPVDCNGWMGYFDVVDG